RGAGLEPAAGLGAEVAPAARLQPFRRVTALRQCVREGHREAAGVGRGEQLLGRRCPCRALGPGLPGQLRTLKGPTRGAGLSLAAHQIALPFRARSALLTRTSVGWTICRAPCSNAMVRETTDGGSAAWSPAARAPSR